MLGTLAKWLRILGYDTYFDPALGDHQLVRLARADSRILLTRDRELARRRGLAVLLIRGDRLDDQIREVLEELDLEPNRSPENSRCPVCNEALLAIDHDTARSLVPPYVAQTQQSFRQCPACGRVYWRGTHWQHMAEHLARLWAEDAT